MQYRIIVILAKYPPWAGFPSPSGETAPWAPRLERLRCPIGAAFGGGKRKKIEYGAPTAPHVSGAYGAHSFKNFRRVIRIPNMYLALKLDNGKMVSIADEQNHRTIRYRISI